MTGVIVSIVVCTVLIILSNFWAIGICAGQVGVKVGEMLKEYINKWLEQNGGNLK